MLIGLREGALAKFRGDMSQRALAAKAGVSRATVNRLEGGEADSASFATINKLAIALGVDADMLVSFERHSRNRR